MRCSLVQVRKTRHRDWVYSMKTVHIDEDQLSQYRQIIYERDPTLPETVQETTPLVEDLKVNFDKRLAKPVEMFSRKMPRVMYPITGSLPDGSEVSLNDFNYHYVQMRPSRPGRP